MDRGWGRSECAYVCVCVCNFQNTHFKLFKMSIFQFKKNCKKHTHTQFYSGQMSQQKLSLRSCRGLHLLDKEFESGSMNMFKELEKVMPKEKKHIRLMFQQMENTTMRSKLLKRTKQKLWS